MESNPRFLITTKQLIFVIVGCILGGLGILMLPREISATCRQDAWISVIVGSLIPLLSLFLIEKLGSIWPSLTVIEISRMLLGKVLGSLLSIVVIAYFLYLSAVVLRGMTEVTSTFMLPQTPRFIIAGLFSVAIWYSAQRGLKVLGRLNEFLFYVFSLGLLFLLPPLSDADLTNLMPVFAVNPGDILKGVAQTTFAFAGIEILLVVYPMVTKKEEIIKAGLTAIGIVVAVFFLITVVCLLVFGSEPLQYEVWPTLTLLKTHEIPIVQRSELFFLILLTGFGIKPAVNFTFGASFALVQLFQQNEKKYYRPLVIASTIVIFSLAIIPDNIFAYFVYLRFVGYMFPFIAVGLPAFLLAVVWVRKGVAANV